ncbi:hypothetical protein GJ744_008241 [Endocarpon pusillum]|uniref:HPP transmembrane region domain-containing protein n=1 Tax=Endocarpon pusillum TaxID=364733 RepID=A0A8H7ALH5_9EURO|nr:hypothetical protein GJ744_008241 [Endocarpon pusillum]
MPLPAFQSLNFDIDKYINPFIPASRLCRLPKPVSRFLGYRDEPRQRIGNIVNWLWSFVGAFCGTALIAGVCKSSATIQSHAPPVIIGSFGAAAILEYHTIESPLAQPRNLILGHFLAALVGISITKLFALLPDARFEDLRWLAGALAVGTSSVVMGATQTVHPPAGATALLAATSPEITALGWYLLALVLLGSTLMLVSACIINNIHRRFPIYWWTPVALSDNHNRRATSGIETVSQAEKEEQFSDAGSRRASRVNTREGVHFEREHEITITAKHIIIPDWLVVNDWERNVLEILRERLKVELDPNSEWTEPSSRHSEATAVSNDEEKAEPPVGIL